MKHFLILLAAAIALAGCQEIETAQPLPKGRSPVPTEKATFIGHWQSDGHRLIISPNGAARYTRVQYLGLMRYEVTSNNIHFNGAGFAMGDGGMDTRFKVVKPPHQVGTAWRMVLARGTFTKGD